MKRFAALIGIFLITGVACAANHLLTGGFGSPSDVPPTIRPDFVVYQSSGESVPVHYIPPGFDRAITVPAGYVPVLIQEDRLLEVRNALGTDFLRMSPDLDLVKQPAGFGKVIRIPKSPEVPPIYPEPTND